MTDRRIRGAPLGDVAVAVVEYESRGYLDALRALRNAGAQGIVVSNGRASRTQPLLKDDADVFVRSGANTGFAAGANLAVNLSSSTAEFILFLNPDADVSASTVKALRDILERDSRIACAAPSLHEAGERIAGEGGRELNLLRAFGFATGLSAFRQSWRLSLHAGRSNADWLGGACLLCRRSALNRVGGFDEAFFLYEEDYDLGRRLRRAGYRLTFAGDLRATHRQGSSGARRETLDALRGYALGFRLRRDREWAVAALLLIGISLRRVVRPLKIGRVATRTNISALMRGIRDGLLGRELAHRDYFRDVQPEGER